MVICKGRILCIDDDIDTCDLFSTWLTQLDYEVKAVATLAAASELAREEEFDLYLVDIRFPDGSGLDFCKLIRETDTQTPVIFCSGDARANTEKQAFEAGATAFLTKPVNLTDLEQTIARLTCGKRRLNPGYSSLTV
jgi:CheY-like chemotaxis protein